MVPRTDHAFRIEVDFRGLRVSGTRRQTGVDVAGHFGAFTRHFRGRIDETQLRERSWRACQFARSDDDHAVLRWPHRAAQFAAVFEIHGNRAIGRDAADIGPLDRHVARIRGGKHQRIAFLADDLACQSVAIGHHDLVSHGGGRNQDAKNCQRRQCGNRFFPSGHRSSM